MYAIIETGGKQYKVKPGDIIAVEWLKAQADSPVTFDHVLLLSDNGKTKIGRPYVAKVAVLAKVLSEGKDEKVISFKFKNKTGYHRKKGHRQPFTRVKIEEIKGG